MNICIEDISTIEKRHKQYTKQRRTIYKVMQQEFFDHTDIFPDNFLNIVIII